MVLPEFKAYSSQGCREHNEDSYLMRTKDNFGLFVVADGLGGHGHGEIASKEAVKSIENCFMKFSGNEEPAVFLKRALTEAQDAIEKCQSSYSDDKPMSSTAVCLMIDGNKAVWVHIGDSRLYMFRNNELLLRTRDHSIPQMLVKLGTITEDEIRSHPDRSRLLCTLGMPWTGYEPFTLSEPVVINEGDAFLLCTDGFWEYITEKEMCACLKSTKNTQEWLQAMTDVVLQNGKDQKMDNYTAVCIKEERS